MHIKIRVENYADAELRQLLNKLSGEERTALHYVLGTHVQEQLREHFLKRDKEPNKRNWPKTHFWLRMRRATALTAADKKKATVTVGDPAMKTKVDGATIKPSGDISPATGKPIRNLVIPMRAEAYGKRPSEFARDTFFVLVSKRKNRAYLALAEDGGRTLRQRLYYRLVKRVTVPRDPRALPSEGETENLLREAVADWIADSLN